LIGLVVDPSCCPLEKKGGNREILRIGTWLAVGLGKALLYAQNLLVHSGRARNFVICTSLSPCGRLALGPELGGPLWGEETDIGMHWIMPNTIIFQNRLSSLMQLIGTFVSD
jgi:hypothetical protein